ncbi:MAG: hypothetical protein KDF56_06795 [Ottowia sp.]|nr:hypothetical protein [Ottowia sp.]
MFALFSAVKQPLRHVLRLAVLVSVVLMAGCATHYVDGAVKDTPASAYARPAHPHPVQLVVEFQTKGAANARATELVKPMVVQAVDASGLFSGVQATPAENAGLLSVTIDNVPLTDDAYRKGFLAGLTLGVAGSTVTDGYVCTVTYTGPGGPSPIVRKSKHAIHTALGAEGAPAGGIKTSSIQEAVSIAMRQMVGAALSALSHDPAFK